MEKIRQGVFSGERSLFMAENLEIYDTVFADGESPLKESASIRLDGCIFKWKYPVWYSRDISIRNTTFLESARSGIWYTDNVSMDSCTLDAPKTFRRCYGVDISNTTMPNAKETLWSCTNVTLNNVSCKGDYFGMNSSGVRAEGLMLSGNYAFDGGQDISVSNSRLVSKDAFWNCKNVIVTDSVIIGEYLGWNSENVTFINCTIESNQGLCYMENVKLVNCKLIFTDLAFEFSTVDAEIVGDIESVKNPTSGRIKAGRINELIMEEDVIDPSFTRIITEE